MKKSTIAAISLLTVLFSGVASANSLSNTAADFGNRVQAQSSDRTIVINADTKYVNVVDGETVQFSVNGQTFAFNFNTVLGETVCDLSKIVPEGVQVRSVRVFVAANPLYHG